MYDVALALSVACFVAVAMFFVRSPKFSMFHPLTFYLAFHGFIFVFRPIVARVLDFQQIYRDYQFTPSASEKLTVILASNLGFLAFAFFCLLSGRVAMRFKHDGFVDAERERLKPLFLWVAAICVPVALYSLATTWAGAATSGIGYAGMVRDAGTGIFINTSSNGYLVEAQLMLASCGALVAWLYRFRVLALLPLLGFVVFRAGTGGRGPFVTALVTVGLLYLYEHRRRFPSLRISAVLVAMVMMFNLVGLDRGASIRRAIGTETSSEVFGEQRVEEKFLEGMDYGNLEYFEFLVYAIPQRTQTYGYFLDTLQIFTEPVPRVLWKDKPVGAPFNRIFLLDYGPAIGMTRSLPGQGWYSLGWPGVIIWCGLWGFGLGYIYRRFVEGKQNALQIAAFMIFLPILIIAFRDGQIITIFRQGLFFFAPIVVWSMIARTVGLPAAHEVRAAALRLVQRRSRTANPLAEPAVAVPPAPVQSPALPPAVRRRRAALATAGNGPRAA